MPGGSVPEYLIYDGLQRKTVTGKMLSRSDTERNRKLRWIELELYRGSINDVPGEALFLHTIGQSVLYHYPDQECTGGGIPTPWVKLPYDARPCRECKPPALPSGARGDGPDLYLEAVRHKVYRCATGRHVIRQLLLYDGKLSTPAETLLLRAAAVDQEMAEAVDGYANGVDSVWYTMRTRRKDDRDAEEGKEDNPV